MNRTLAVRIARVGTLCVVVLAIWGSAALPQTIDDSVNPRAARAERAPAGGCKPIGLTGAGEAVFPYRCKEFIERQKAANQKTPAEENQKPVAAARKPDATQEKTADVNSATAERKPAAAEEKSAAAKESPAAKQQESVVPKNSPPATDTVGTIPSPRRVEREARGRTIGPPGCTHFRSYDPASGTYRAFDRQRRQCRELIVVTVAAKAVPPSRVPLPPDASKAPPQSEGSAAAVAPSTTSATIADSRSGADAASANTRTIEAQVAAATTLAEHLTAAAAAPPPDMKGNDTDKPGRAETLQRGSAETTASVSANDTDLLVAVLMARPDITSVSDLTGKTIAIDDRYSASIGSVRTAIVAAGAPEIELSGGQTAAITRLLNGGVPAAILALVSADAAEGFPEIAGFKILDLPLSPRALKARR